MIRILLGLFLFCAAALALLVGTVVQLLIQLLPYLFVGAVVWLVLHILRPRTDTAPAPARRATRSRPPPKPAGYSARPLGWTSPPPVSGWAWMPVWMGPPPVRPRPEVIDAEVIEDDRSG